MRISSPNPNQLSQGQQIKGQVEKVCNQVKALDNQGADLSATAGEVLLPDGKARLEKEGMYFQDVVNATVHFDPASQQLQNGSVDVKSFYTTSYGDSAPTFTNYSKETRHEKTTGSGSSRGAFPCCSW